MISKLLLILLISIPTMAGQSLELIVGGISYHVMDQGVSQLYSNKISKDGRMILTPTVGVKITNRPEYFTYDSIAIFKSTNSVGSPINGAILGSGWALGPIDLGFVLGGYIQNNEDFKYKGIQPYSVCGNTNALVPLAGVEINLHIKTGESTFIGVNNILTPIITNHNISFGLNL